MEFLAFFDAGAVESLLRFLPLPVIICQLGIGSGCLTLVSDGHLLTDH